jgi:pilus assembly protein CpaE
MPSTSKLLLLTTSDANWVWLNEVCADKFLVIKESGSFEAVAQRVNLVSPQLAVVDFTPQSGFDPQAVVEQLRTIEPKLPVLALGRKSTSETLMIALRAGTRDFLDLDTAQTDAQSTLIAVRERSDAPVKDQQGHAVAVLGARAGVGATTFSVNMAAQLRRNTGQDVLLLDFGLPLGDGQIHLPCEEKQGTMDFVECVRNLKRFDSNLARTAFKRNPESGVALLSLPRNIADLREISSQDALKFLNLIKSFFGAVVIDLCGFTNNDFIANLLYTADTVIVLTDQCVPKVVSCSELLKALADRGVTSDRINLVVNQYDSELSLTSQHIASKVNPKQVFTMPSRRSRLIDSVNLGRVLSLSEPRDPYAKAIEHIATELKLMGAGKQVGLMDRLKQWRKP